METLVGIGLLAVFMELIDSSLGMLYGTILSPLLISAGFDAKLVIPSILISQAIGGLIATVRHHRYKSANFIGWTRHTKIVLAVVLPGVLACFLGAFVAVSVPGWALKTYIGLLAVAMGILCVRPYSYQFAWKKIFGIGVLAGFNKALSGGGFGPVTSTGKILAGVNPRVSIATTAYAEVPICLLSFLFWLVLRGGIETAFPLTMCLGAAFGAIIGPWITYKLKSDRLRGIVGILAIISGIWCVVKLFL